MVGMKTYLVGGSVRDKLLKIPAHDTDYLVTGARKSELLRRGLVKVGQSFPVYLDRVNGDEYTLAASVEEDLQRRDLTINAMAIDPDGNLVDLFQGCHDLEMKVLRHVREENFFTDPLRALRAVRFFVQLPGFTIHPETEALIRKVVKTSAYGALPGERIIKELRRVFQCERAELFFETLRRLEALDPHFAEFEGAPGKFPEAKEEQVRFAWLCSDLTLAKLDSFCERLGIQNDWKDTAAAWIRYKGLKGGAEELLAFFYAIDSFRRPGILDDLIKTGAETKLKKAFEKISGVGISSVSKDLAGKEIAGAIRSERLRILKEDTEFRSP